MSITYFGAQTEHWGYDLAKYPQGAIVHANVRLDRIEAVRGVYTWPEEYDSLLDVDPARNKLIIGLRTFPKHYRLFPSLDCSQPYTSNYPEIVDLIAAVVERYGPYAIELGNENDAPSTMMAPEYQWIISCWDSGYQYGLYTQFVYQRIKQRFPGLTIIGGAFMLDGTEAFVESAIANGKADWWSFHCYATHNGDNIDICGVKAAYMQRLTNKKLYASEAALLRWSGEGCDLQDFEQAQAEYVRYIGEHCHAWGLVACSWYTIGGNGWACSDLRQPGYRQWIRLFKVE